MPQLDAVRAIAVLFVLIFHFIPDVDRFAPLGGIGVRLFFVLSGFLITSILLESRQRPLSEALRVFYARRILRIFPLFYFALFVSFVFDFGAVRSTIAWHLTYLTNFLIYSRGEWPGAVTHFWSLAVEEQFYLVWPLLVLTLPARALPWIIVAVIPLAPLTMWALDNRMASVLPVSSLDALGLGALLALPAARRHVAALGGFAGIPLLAATIVLRWFHVGGYPVDVVMGSAVALVSAWFVSGAAHGFSGVGRAVLEWRPLISLGQMSYGIYVYHALMPYFLARLFPIWTLGTGQRFVVLLIATVITAAISFRYLEQPILSLKQRFVAGGSLAKSSFHILTPTLQQTPERY